MKLCMRGRVPLSLTVAGAGLLGACAGAARQRLPPAGETPLAARLDSVAAGARRTHGVPGLAVALVEQGRTTLTRGYGFADSAAGRPMTDTTAHTSRPCRSR